MRSTPSRCSPTAARNSLKSCQCRTSTSEYHEIRKYGVEVYRREINISNQIEQSFFLWGPRQSGKSTLLRERFSEAFRVDLLRSAEFVRYTRDPGRLAEELRSAFSGRTRAERPFVVIDEIQKVPALLDEVHALIEEEGIRFALCGSSARKLRRGHANLLGGRALRYVLFGLVSRELGGDYDPILMANRGNLPRHYGSGRYRAMQKAYVEDYLKEEIASEGLVRNLPAFSDFLRQAAISDTEIVNFENVARECGVSAKSVKEYYQILVDTLLGTFVPSFTVRAKRRTVSAPRFYFADVGSVNHLARRGELSPGDTLFGKAFESVVLHELRAHAAYSERDYDIRYWRLTTGTEVDFILGNMDVAIECKAVERIRADHLKGLEALSIEHPEIKERIVVCLESRPRTLENGIHVLPIRSFLASLWRGEFPVT